MHKKTILHTVAIVALLSSSAFIKPDESKTIVGKLVNKIQQKAQEWVRKCIEPMKVNQKQLICNMLGLSCAIDAGTTKKSLNTAQACAEYISSQQESDELIKQSSEQLQQDIQELLNTYMIQVQQKLAQRNPETIDEDAFGQALEEKIHELIARISLIYYQAVYEHMRSNNLEDQLTYMFDQDGIIAEDNRTQPLPEPAIVQEQFRQLLQALHATA